MADLGRVRLDLINRPENVMLVRETLTGVAEAIELDSGLLNHIRTAATEACNNVVRHAYDGEEGPLDVEVLVASSELEVVVRDQGMGIHRHGGAPEGSTLGVGLPVIRALASRVEFGGGAEGGTEVRMTFAEPNLRVPYPPPDDRVELPSIAREAFAAGAVAAVTTTPGLARTVLPRMLSVLAARAHFSTDRIFDTHLLADELVAHCARSTAANHLSVAFGVEPRTLELHVGPLDVGDASQLIRDSGRAGTRGPLAILSDRHRVQALGSCEVLILGLSDNR
jgi:serine/threonine-protein kinase RsbW